jgi:protein disulfide isomerase family A protein 3
MEAFAKFVQDYTDKKLEPYVKSEPIPTEHDGDVKVCLWCHSGLSIISPGQVLVGKNFDSIVNEPGKDVFVEFYAPCLSFILMFTPRTNNMQGAVTARGVILMEDDV